ncbi:hypothetical protein ElyMa_003190900 [Elysia marginata]|uniref:Secreted protein n=1 Tax=Elysia marginata TaxID=1093978 RepID=A0AAV4J4H9_9GAST|nr:hypothetical protein ElyMa_003190900 [Elysia marginata]
MMQFGRWLVAPVTACVPIATWMVDLRRNEYGLYPRFQPLLWNEGRGEIDLAWASRTRGVPGSVRDPWPKGGNLWPHVLSVWRGPRPLGFPRVPPPVLATSII